MIGRLGATTPEAREDYARLFRLAFSKYTISRILGGPDLDSYLKDVVKKYTGNPETLMFDPMSPTSHCKTYEFGEILFNLY